MRNSTLTVPAPPSAGERARTRFVLLSSGVGGLLLVVLAFWAPGWIGAATWAFGLSLVYLAYALATRDGLLLRFLLFGLVAGWVELLPDHWLVAHTGTLVYAPGEPIIDSSPLYMPFSWMVVFVQVGYLGWVLARRFSMPVAMAGVGVLGALIVPFYEYVSIAAGWWSYQNTPMIATVPYYIILAEGLLMVSLPPMFRACERLPLRYVPALALVQGLIIWGSAALAYTLVG